MPPHSRPRIREQRQADQRTPLARPDRHALPARPTRRPHRSSTWTDPIHHRTRQVRHDPDASRRTFTTTSRADSPPNPVRVLRRRRPVSARRHGRHLPRPPRRRAPQSADRRRHPQRARARTSLPCLDPMDASPRDPRTTPSSHRPRPRRDARRHGCESPRLGVASLDADGERLTPARPCHRPIHRRRI
jgi:hypothetical protein